MRSFVQQIRCRSLGQTKNVFERMPRYIRSRSSFFAQTFGEIEKEDPMSNVGKILPAWPAKIINAT